MWTDKGNGKHSNNAVASDSSAIHRGGALYTNPLTGELSLKPWEDDDQDNFSLNFVIPGAIENVVETPFGWEGEVAGSNWQVGVADLDGVKLSGKLLGLDDFTAPGAQSYVRVPIAEIPATGEYRDIKKQLGGNWQDFGFYLQPALTAQEILDGSSQPDWAKYSLAIYHLEKRNDITGFANYMTGKAGHIPAPIAVGFRSNGTTVTGWTYGAWEIDQVTGILTKVFDAAVISSWNNTATVVVDATLGVTAVGAGFYSNQLTIAPCFINTVGAGTVVDFNLHVISLPEQDLSTALYVGVGGIPTDAIADSIVTLTKSSAVPIWLTHTYSPQPIITSADLCVANGKETNTGGRSYDSTTGGDYLLNYADAGSYVDPLPDPWIVDATIAWTFSTYVTVEAGGPDAPTNPNAAGGDEEVTVSWTDSPTADSHNLYWSLSSPVTIGDNKITAATTPYVHTGRTNGVEVFYAIEAENAGGVSPLSSEVSATPEVPAAGGGPGNGLAIAIGVMIR